MMDSLRGESMFPPYKKSYPGWQVESFTFVLPIRRSTTGPELASLPEAGWSPEPRCYRAP